MHLWGFGVRVMVFNATVNNIILWRSVLLVEETRVPGVNHRPAASHWKTLSHNVVSSTPCLSENQMHLWEMCKIKKNNNQLYNDITLEYKRIIHLRSLQGNLPKLKFNYFKIHLFHATTTVLLIWLQKWTVTSPN